MENKIINPDREEKHNLSLLDQKNKGHKKLSKKLEKRREKKKNKKKTKEDRKLKKSMIDKVKHKHKNKVRAEGKLKRYLKRFLKVYDEDINEFLDIFEGLDTGAEISIEGMENQNVSSCLKKIFKELGQSLNDNKEWYVDKEKIVQNLKVVVKTMMTRIMEEKRDKQEAKKNKERGKKCEKSESSESEDDDDNDEDDDDNSIDNELDLPKKSLKKEKNQTPPKKIVAEAEIPSTDRFNTANQDSAKPDNRFKIPAMPVPSHNPNKYGPSKEAIFNKVNAGIDTNQDTDNYQQKDTGKSDEQAFSDQFNTGTIAGKGKNRLDKSSRNPQKILTEDEKVAEEAKQQLCADYFAEYDKVNRPLTLMEMHQVPIFPLKKSAKNETSKKCQKGPSIPTGRI